MTQTKEDLQLRLTIQVDSKTWENISSRLLNAAETNRSLLETERQDQKWLDILTILPSGITKPTATFDKVGLWWDKIKSKPKPDVSDNVLKIGLTFHKTTGGFCFLLAGEVLTIKLDGITKEELKQLQETTEQRNARLGITKPSARKIRQAEPITTVQKPLMIKAGLHTELQKFGDSRQLTFEDLFEELIGNNINLKEAVQRKSIEVIGLDITLAQQKALHAIQSLLTQTDYKGNIGNTERYRSKKDNPFKFSGNVPGLKFNPSEYLDAYGVGKRKTIRGKEEYFANERAEALRALRDLHEQQYLLIYERKYREKNQKGKPEEKVDIIRTTNSLIHIIEGYKGLTASEAEKIKAGHEGTATDNKLKTIAVLPCPMLVDQVDTYFVLKPANCYQEIKLLNPHASKYVYRFIDYLMAQVAQRESRSRGTGNKDWKIKINYQKLAANLRMDSWLKTRNWKAIRGSLQKCYDTAQKLGYLKSCQTIQGKTGIELEELVLNPKKFYQRQQADGQRKQIEATPIEA